VSDVLKVRLSAEGIQEVIGALKKVEDQTRKTSGAGKEAGDTLGALGTLFAAQQIAAFAAHALEAADQLGKLSQKTGIAVEQLSVFTYMSQQADVSQEDLGKGFAKLSKTLDALNKGDAAAADAFKRIGLSAQDLAGLGLDQIILKVANAQSQYADGAGKAAVMMALFGKSGANLIPLMNDLANGGFENAKKKLQELGLVISGDTARAAQDFNDSMKRLEMAAQGVTVQVAGTMLPGLTKAVDGLVAALAGMPAGAKAFSGTFLVIGSAATAATVAVRALYGAIAGLGPIGLAVVAISALVAGLISLQAAQEEAHKRDLQDISAKGRMIQNGDKLVDQYQKEAQALEKAGSNKREAAKHSKALKEIEDKLIEISPAYQQILKDETKGINDKAEAMRALDVAQKKALETQLAQIRADRDRLSATVEAAKKAGPLPEVKGEGGATEFAAVDVLPALQEKLRVANETVAALEAALGISKPGVAPKKQDDKKSLTATDESLVKAQAAAMVAAAKRGAEAQKQALDEFTALNEAFYKEGLIDLETYLRGRETAIKAQADLEVASLQAQIAAEQSIQGTLKTPAEKAASLQKLADLSSQIKAKQADAELKLQALERTGDDLRKAATLDAIKLEGDLEQAKGRTAAASIKAIQAEYEERIRQAKSPQAKKALEGLRDTAIGKANNDQAGRQVQYAQTGLEMDLTSVDQKRQANLISEAQAVDLRTQAYEKWIPVIQEAALLQLQAAQAVGDPALVQAAEKQLQDLDGMKIKLANMKDQLKDFKDAARDAFIDGFANFLETLLDKTSSLTDKMKALGFTIAQAIVKLAAMKVAQAAAGAMGFAEGGPIYGPGSSTSDSIPIMASAGEFMVRAAAVRHYGLDTLAALNGLRLPKGFVRGYAEGGPIAPTLQPIPVRGDFSHSMQIGLDDGLILRALDSPEGAKVLLKQTTANSKKFNRALGR